MAAALIVGSIHFHHRVHLAASGAPLVLAVYFTTSAMMVVMNFFRVMMMDVVRRHRRSPPWAARMARASDAMRMIVRAVFVKSQRLAAACHHPAKVADKARPWRLTAGRRCRNLWRCRSGNRQIRDRSKPRRHQLCLVRVMCRSMIALFQCLRAFARYSSERPFISGSIVQPTPYTSPKSQVIGNISAFSFSRHALL